MAHLRFFPKLFAAFAFFVVLTAASTGWAFLNGAQERILEARRGDLEAHCALLGPFAEGVLEAGAVGDARAGLRDLKRTSGVRITLVDAGGGVLLDSDVDPERMDNLARRPELLEARSRRGFGSASRFSRAVAQRLLYVAQEVGTGQALGWVRVSIPLDRVHADVAALRLRVLTGAGVAVATALLLAWFAARRLAEPLVVVARTADDLRLHVEPDAEVPGSGDELQRVLETLAILRMDLHRQVDRVSADEEQLRAMLAGMVEGVVAVDGDDRVVFTNQAAERLLGLDPTLGADARLWHVVRAPGLDELFAEARQGKSAPRREFVLPSGGRERVLRAQAHGFRAGGAAGVVAVFDDITDLRRLERVRQDFVANVSHELKTPLTSIRGYVETLQAGDVDSATTQRFLGKIETGVKRLTHLVSDLLSLARVEAQRDALELTPIPCRSLALAAVRRQDESARRQGIECSLEAPSGEVTVMGDSESMTQVLDNLLDNAIKYTAQEGRVVLRLGEGETHAVLEVEDTGSGIPPEDLERVFERFYRVDRARSRALGGTGLGLSIVKHLVGAMGGKVSVTSTLGVGTCFRVELPLA